MPAPRAEGTALVFPPRAWLYLAQHWLGLNQRDTVMSWQAIVACQLAGARAMRHSLALLDRVPTRNEKLIHATVWSKVQPRILIEAFEQAVATGQLSREEGNRWQEAVLRLTTKQAQWQ